MARAAQIDSSTVGRTRRANGVAQGGDDEPRVIPIALAPLLAPYKKQGRLSLRIERLPQLARFSKGSKNNDGSWSVAPDELEDLTYQLPEGMNADHTLAIRIVSLTGGNTLAVVDFPVSPGAGPSSDEPEVASASAAEARDDTQLQALRDELKKMKAELAARDSEISSVRKEVERTEAELAAARAAWEAEFKEKLAAVAAQTATQVQQNREAWEKEQLAQLAKAEAHAQELIAAARETAEREAKDALAKAEAAWQAGETQRRAAVEAQGQEKSAKAMADVRAQSHQAHDQGREDELRAMREKLASTQATVAERDAAVAQAVKARDEERARLQREMQEALAKAEHSWRAAEAGRLAAAEAEWRQKSASAATDARTQNESTRDQDHQRELAGLREKLAALQSTLTEREAALAAAANGAGETDERRRKEAQDTLAKAEHAWKAAEAERLAAAEATWRETSARALAEARAQAGAVEPGGETEFRVLRDKLASLQALLSDREATLARADKTMEAAHLRWQKDAQQAISKAVRERKADETARLAAAEGQARKQMAKELADATARYEAAEAALAQLRLNTKDDSRLQNELAALRASLAARESELAHARSVMSHHDDADSEAPHAGRSATKHEQSRAPDKRRLMRDAGLAACVGVAAVVFYPQIEALIFGAPPAPKKPLAVAEVVLRAASPVIEQRTAVVVRYARMRAEPSKSGAVVAALPIGVEVTVVETRDKWVLVRTAGEGKTEPREGWVFASLLKDIPAGKTSPAK